MNKQLVSMTTAQINSFPFKNAPARGHVSWKDTFTGRTRLLGGHIYWEDTSTEKTRCLGRHVEWEDTCLQDFPVW